MICKQRYHGITWSLGAFFSKNVESYFWIKNVFPLKIRITCKKRICVELIFMFLRIFLGPLNFFSYSELIVPASLTSYYDFHFIFLSYEGELLIQLSIWKNKTRERPRRRPQESLKRLLNTLNIVSMAAVKVGIKPESFSMPFIKYINCIIFENIGKLAV